MMQLISPHLAAALAAATLAALIAAAMVTDARTHRIPNRVVLCGLLAALLLAGITPAGDGYFAPVDAGSPGLLRTVLGAATGLLVFVPLYAVRAMGAGDAKLMAMTGAFLGPGGAAEAAVLTLALGGVLSVAVAAWNGALRQAVSNARYMLTDAVVRGATGQTAAIEPVMRSAGKVPYAIAIGAGTAAYVVLVRTQHTIF